MLYRSAYESVTASSPFFSSVRFGYKLVFVSSYLVTRFVLNRLKTCVCYEQLCNVRCMLIVSIEFVMKVEVWYWLYLNVLAGRMFLRN
jgi:hypothetical protein